MKVGWVPFISARLVPAHDGGACNSRCPAITSQDQLSRHSQFDVETWFIFDANVYGLMNINHINLLQTSSRLAFDAEGVTSHRPCAPRLPRWSLTTTVGLDSRPWQLIQSPVDGWDGTGRTAASFCVRGPTWIASPQINQSQGIPAAL